MSDFWLLKHTESWFFILQCFVTNVPYCICGTSCTRHHLAKPTAPPLGLIYRKSRNFSVAIRVFFFVSSKPRCLQARNFAVILIFIPFATYEKISFTEWAGRSFTNGFSGLSRNAPQIRRRILFFSILNQQSHLLGSSWGLNFTSIKCGKPTVFSFRILKDNILLIFSLFHFLMWLFPMGKRKDRNYFATNLLSNTCKQCPFSLNRRKPSCVI